MNKTQYGKTAIAKPLRYHLRFQIIPGRNAEMDARILCSFCKAHSVEEVVLFLSAEEWNNGLLSAREEKMWFDAVKRVKSVLDKAGVVVSLNPWMTVLHCDRGRRFPGDRKFKPMVSPAGNVSRACASFADMKWRAYICGLYGRFAKLGFRVIWVEDDFRYHNHSPLDWGGGFEDEVLNRFAREIGRKVTRKEAVKNILKPGLPHPWRIKWMETWRDIHLEVAGGLADAVAENASGGTKIGLMSSLPGMHSIEGRDWHKLFDAFSINGQVAHRPHYSGYSESLGKDKDFSIMMLDVQKNFRPANCEVAPEVDNFPFTRWSKSDSMTWAEMGFCMFYGSDALFLDLFPFSGNTADQEPQIGELLDKSRPGLEWISSRFSKDLQTCGVGIPWIQDAQAYVRTARGEGMQELNATSFEPGHFLLPYGVPVSANWQRVNAVFGNLAWAFDENKILEMLSAGLFLDGISADILCQRGFGEYIGVKSKGFVNREESLYSIEMVNSRETGVARGFYLNANLLACICVLEPLGGADEWTTIITPERKRFGAGMVVYKNKLGGRVVAYSAPNPASLPRSYQRQVIAQNAVSFLAGRRFNSVMVTGNPYMMPVHFKGKDRQFVVVFNGLPDADKPVIHMDAAAAKPAEATLLVPMEKPVKVKIDSVVEKEGVMVTSQYRLPYLSFLVLEW